MATLDWRELWPLANSRDFISLEPDTRTAFLVSGDSAIGKLRSFYQEQYTKLTEMPYEAFQPYYAKWSIKESQLIAGCKSDAEREKMQAFYDALRGAENEQETRKNKPTQMALDYMYNQQETPE